MNIYLRPDKLWRPCSSSISPQTIPLTQLHTLYSFHQHWWSVGCRCLRADCVLLRGDKDDLTHQLWWALFWLTSFFSSVLWADSWSVLRLSSTWQHFKVSHKFQTCFPTGLHTINLDGQIPKSWWIRSQTARAVFWWDWIDGYDKQHINKDANISRPRFYLYFACTWFCCDVMAQAPATEMTNTAHTLTADWTLHTSVHYECVTMNICIATHGQTSSLTCILHSTHIIILRGCSCITYQSLKLIFSI